MTTPWAIVLTQLPIAIACLIAAWELRGLRRDLAEVLRRLSQR